MPSPKEKGLAYEPALDGLRALAALMVVAFHVSLPRFEGGFLGVELFFVLSGYLISSLLRREVARTGSVDLKSFWTRRVARLMPTLALMLAAFVLLSPLLFPQADLLAEVGFSLFYLSNYSRVLWESPDLMGHTWSLAVEMQY